MRRMLILFVSVALAAGVGLAGDEKAPEKKTPRQIEKDIQELKGKIEQLEQQAQARKEEEERQHELLDIQKEAKERLKDYEAQLQEMQSVEPDQDENGPAHKELRLARLTHLTRCKGLDRKIVALKGAEGLDAARKLLDELEVLHTKWWMVSEPRFESAAELESMQRSANELNNEQLQKIVAEVRAMALKDQKSAEQQFQLWTARRDLRRKTDEMVDKFWRSVDEIERARDREE